MIVNKKRYKGLQAYKVKGKQEYLYAFHTTDRVGAQGYAQCDAYTALTEGDRYPHVHGSCSLDYLREDCTPMSFKKLPEDIQEHLQRYVEEWES